MAENKKGRKTQVFERILNKQNRNIAFSKRKMGIVSKSYTLASRFGCEIAIVFLTKCSKWHLYSYPSSQEDINNLLRCYLENLHRSKCITAAEVKMVRILTRFFFIYPPIRGVKSCAFTLLLPLNTAYWPHDQTSKIK